MEALNYILFVFYRAISIFQNGHGIQPNDAK